LKIEVFFIVPKDAEVLQISYVEAFLKPPFLLVYVGSKRPVYLDVCSWALGTLRDPDADGIELDVGVDTELCEWYLRQEGLVGAAKEALAFISLEAETDEERDFFRRLRERGEDVFVSQCKRHLEVLVIPRDLVEDILGHRAGEVWPEEESGYIEAQRRS